MFCTSLPSMFVHVRSIIFKIAAVTVQRDLPSHSRRHQSSNQTPHRFPEGREESSKCNITLTGWNRWIYPLCFPFKSTQHILRSVHEEPRKSCTFIIVYDCIASRRNHFMVLSLLPFEVVSQGFWMYTYIYIDKLLVLVFSLTDKFYVIDFSMQREKKTIQESKTLLLASKHLLNVKPETSS